MRVLVTGGAGYIGSHACKALAEAGHAPIAFDNLSTGHDWAVQWGPLVQGDINNKADIERAFQEHRPEAIMHFAALSVVGDSVKHPSAYYATNVSGTLNLLEAVQQHGIQKFVFSSTCATYGEPEHMPLTEQTPQNPLNPYGHSKLMVERILEDLSQIGKIGAIALRYFNASGADPKSRIGEEHDPETHLIPIILQAASGKRSHVSIFGEDYDTHDGTCIRDYVHVDDLSSAHVAALERVELGTFDAFNLGTGSGHSVREVIDAAKAVTGKDFEVQKAARRPGDAPILVADASKAKKDLNWSPSYTSLEDIVRTAWTWMQNGEHSSTREA